MNKRKAWLGVGKERTNSTKDRKKHSEYLRQEFVRRGGGRKLVTDSETGTIRLAMPSTKDLESVGL